MGTLYKRTPNGKYYAEFTDACGQRIRRSTGTTVKQDAKTILLKWENDANNERHGIVVNAATTVEELLLEYLDSLGNTGDKHRAMSEQRLRAMINFNEWLKPAQINQHELETCVRQLTFQKSTKSPVKKLSLRSQSHYIGAFKSFTKWLTNVRRALPRDPLISVRKPNFSADRKLIRRFLLHEEWKWLAKTEHALLWETAIQTGYRSAEIRCIRPEHLGKSFIALPAKLTKNKQNAKQYITASLHDRLNDALPFVVPDEERLAELLRIELAEARLLAEDAAKPKKLDPGFLEPTDPLGHVLDFHALRHTCGAWLVVAGVNLKVVQKVMRHSSITLTLDTYGHLVPGAEQDAIKHFETLMLGS
jgi:integrase